MKVPSWHWTKQPNAEQIKKKCIKTLQPKYWLGKKRDIGTMRKLWEGNRKSRKNNPDNWVRQKEVARNRWTGKGNPKWKGGISKSYEEGHRINNPKWRKIRKVMLEKYPCCQECGSFNKLVVHHIIHWDECHSDNEDNLTVVCRSCHMKIHPPIKI